MENDEDLQDLMALNTIEEDSSSYESSSENINNNNSNTNIKNTSQEGYGGTSFIKPKKVFFDDRRADDATSSNVKRHQYINDDFSKTLHHLPSIINKNPRNNNTNLGSGFVWDFCLNFERMKNYKFFFPKANGDNSLGKLQPKFNLIVNSI